MTMTGDDKPSIRNVRQPRVAIDAAGFARVIAALPPRPRAGAGQSPRKLIDAAVFAVARAAAARVNAEKGAAD